MSIIKTRIVPGLGEISLVLKHQLCFDLGLNTHCINPCCEQDTNTMVFFKGIERNACENCFDGGFIDSMISKIAFNLGIAGVKISQEENVVYIEFMPQTV